MNQEVLAVRWEGAQFVWHSLAHVNHELCRALMRTERVELSIVPNEPMQFDPADSPAFAPLAERCFAPLSRPADVHVRHFYPPRFERADEGHFVLMQPWEYGYLPEHWIEPIQERVSEVWCYSNYVRDVYLASEIPEEKLQVIPLGVDTTIFRPEAPPYVFTIEPGAARLPVSSSATHPHTHTPTQPFIFLFAGGTLHRKGIDILLDAYLRAFSAYDDVCLVIKDTCTRTVYQGQNERDRILGLVNDVSRPPIVYLDDDLSAHQLAGIYTAADCLVQPYRGEGFCLPALEAMACGKTVIVTEGGPTDDFVDETVGWSVQSERRPFGDGRIGDMWCTGATWMFEVAVNDLARTMREAYSNREEAARRGKQAADRVVNGWTWDHAAAKVVERLEVLKEQPVPPPPPRRSLPVVIEDRAAPGNRAQRRHPGKEAASSPSAQVTRETPRISLCMIVKDEQRVLSDCLASVKPWVDEMIVVDTGSTDRTVEIARSFGAKLFHFPWCNSFSAARNESLRHATGDWNLWVDADDTLPAECGLGLRELVDLAEDRNEAFIIQVHFPAAPQDDGLTIVDHVKLFRNRPEYRFEGRIHEQILEPIQRTGGTAVKSNIYVVHSGYDYSPEGQQKKRERDMPLLLMDIEERPGHPLPWYNLGMTHFHLRDFADAIPALDRSLLLCKKHESLRRKIFAHLCGCYLGLHNYDDARRCVEQGLFEFPGDPELLFRTANLYRDLGDLNRAVETYYTLRYRREVGHIDSLDVTMTGFKANFNLGTTFIQMGRLPEAEAELRAAIDAYPRFYPSWLHLGGVYVQQRRFDDARAIALRLSEFEPSQAEGLFRQIAAARGMPYGDQTLARIESKAPPAAAVVRTALPAGGPDWENAPCFGRRDTILRTLKQLYALYPGPVRIVETGTIRDEAPAAQNGDGWSTVAWGWYCAQTGGKAITVDNDPGALEICQRVTAPFKAFIEYEQAESVSFLRQWNERKWGDIHLFYLDSVDYFDRERSEQHSLAELEAVLPSLAPTCLVLFDDTEVSGTAADGTVDVTGKGRRSVPFLLSNGFHLEWSDGKQVLLSRIAPSAQAVVTEVAGQSKRKRRAKSSA